MVHLELLDLLLVLVNLELQEHQEPLVHLELQAHLELLAEAVVAVNQVNLAVEVEEEVERYPEAVAEEAPKAAQHFHIQPNLTPAPVRLKVNPITKERLVKRILQRKDGPQPVDVANTISRGKGTSLRAAAKQARQEARRKARKAMYDGNYDQESKGPPPHTFRGPGGYQEFR